MFGKKTWAVLLGDVLGDIAVWLLTALFLWWGWSVLAPLLNAPMFSYMEMVALRVGFHGVARTIRSYIK
jgi:Co/Zn/Cd efflux system component